MVDDPPSDRESTPSRSSSGLRLATGAATILLRVSGSLAAGGRVVRTLLGPYPPAAASDAAILVFMTGEGIPGARRGRSTPPPDAPRRPEVRRRAVLCARCVSSRRSAVYSIVQTCAGRAAVPFRSDGRREVDGVLRCRPRHKRRCEWRDLCRAWGVALLPAAARVVRWRSAGRLR